MALPNGVGGGGLDVDIVDADAGTAHDLEQLGLGQHLGGDLGRGPDREALVVADNGTQLGGLQARLEIDVATALRENLDGARGELVGNENLGLGHFDDSWRLLKPSP